MYTLFCLRGSLSLFARGGGGSSSFSSPMFSTTSSSSSSSWRRYVLFHLDLLLFIAPVPVLKICTEHAVPATTRNHGFWTRLSFFSVESTVSFSSSRRLLARRSTPSSSTRPNVRRSVLCISEESSALPTGETIITVVCAESRPFRRDEEDPVASDAPSKTSFFSRFFRSSALSALCDCWSSTCSTRLLLSFSSFSRRGFLVHVESRDVLVLLEVQKVTKARRRPRIFFLSLSLSLSFAQSVSRYMCGVKETQVFGVF